MTTVLRHPEDWHEARDHRRRLGRGLNEESVRIDPLEAFVDAYPSGGVSITANATQDSENKLTIADLSVGSIDLQLLDVVATWPPGEVFTYTFKQINQSGVRRLRLVPFGTQQIDGAVDYTFPNTSLAALTIIPAPGLSTPGWLIESSYLI